MAQQDGSASAQRDLTEARARLSIAEDELAAAANEETAAVKRASTLKELAEEASARADAAQRAAIRARHTLEGQAAATAAARDSVVRAEVVQQQLSRQAQTQAQAPVRIGESPSPRRPSGVPHRPRSPPLFSSEPPAAQVKAFASASNAYGKAPSTLTTAPAPPTAPLAKASNPFSECDDFSQPPQQPAMAAVGRSVAPAPAPPPLPLPTFRPASPTCERHAVVAAQAAMAAKAADEAIKAALASVRADASACPPGGGPAKTPAMRGASPGAALTQQAGSPQAGRPRVLLDVPPAAARERLPPGGISVPPEDEDASLYRRHNLGRGCMAALEDEGEAARNGKNRDGAADADEVLTSLAKSFMRLC